MCRVNFLKRTKNGILFFCYRSEMYQLLFKNINFNLTLYEFNCFSKYIRNIDEQYWKQEYRHSVYNKYIPIPSIQENLIILLDTYDLFELRELLNFQSKSLKMLSFPEIDYKIIMN